MNIKVYNESTGKYELVGSGTASEMQIIDSSAFDVADENNINTSEDTTDGETSIETETEITEETTDEETVVKPSYNTVEECIVKNREDINVMKKDIKYIYENGTMGGGSGGGGSSAFPTIKLTSTEEIIVQTENTFTIAFFFTSPNPGDGTVNYVITKKATLESPVVDLKKTVRQGRNGVTFDPLESGEYELTVSVIDSLGVGSSPVVLDITCGALELSTRDSLSSDISIDRDVELTYTVASIFNGTISLLMTMPNGEIETTIVEPGTHKINIGKLTSIGVKTLKLMATCDGVESNTLTYHFIVTDTSTMFMSSTFESGEYRNDQTISVNYRISLLGARQFLTDVYIDGELYDKDVISAIGHNFYSLIGLPLGTHKIKFISRTLESENPVTAELEPPDFLVIAAEGQTYQFSRDSLVISLDARVGKSNTQAEDKRTVWQDTEPDATPVCTLNYFAFNDINGWVPVSDEDPTVDALTFAGKTYAEVDLSPLSGSLSNGLTVEMYFSATDTGNRVAGVKNVVMDLFDSADKSTGKGLLIDVEEAYMRSSYADSLNSKYNNGEYVHMTMVINRIEDEIIMYTNGAISGYSKISQTANFLTTKKIVLGARCLDGVYQDHSNCKIRTFRVYNRALSDLEVFKNTVADLTVSEQDTMIELHEGQSVIPTMKLTFDEGALNSSSSITPVDIEYTDPSDPSKNIVLYNSMIKKQGTTSTTYPVSNYTLNLYDAGIPIDYAPKDDWVPENIFTLKADYMDSSHANNTGIAAFASNMFNRLGKKTQAQLIEPKAKTTIAGFMINLTINGVSRGLFNFNTDRYGAKNYGLTVDDYANTAVSYEASSNSGVGTGFHSTDWDDLKGAFKVRYFKGEADTSKYMTFDADSQVDVMSQGVHTEFEEICKWINEAGNDTSGRFYAEFEEHLDLDFTLHYLLIVEIFGLMDNLEKNMVLTYFGEQYDSSTGAVFNIWTPMLYDLDTSVGLSNNGSLKYQPCVNFFQEEGMPADHQYNGTTSLLWTCVKKYFAVELKAAYANLRKLGILTLDNLMEYYQGETIDKVSPYFYSVDARLKYIAPSTNGSSNDTYYSFCKGRRIEYTKKWLGQRITFLDSIYEYGNENSPDGDYWKYIQMRYLKRYSTATEFTVSVKAASPLFLTTVDDSMIPFGKQYFVSNDKYYSIPITINNAADGAMFGITFGPQLLDVKFSDEIRLTSMFLEHGTRLIELNIPNNEELTEIIVDNCTNLQYFNVSGCTALGSVVGKETLTFDNCPNLREIDFSNTSVGGFTTQSGGGILEVLNCDNSRISNFVLNKQHYIETLEIEGCTLLTKVEVEDCRYVKSVNFPNSIISIFRVLDCPRVSYVNCSNTPYLTSAIDPTDPEGRENFLIDNCPSLKTIVMQNLNNEDMTYLDLINVENLEELTASGCDYLNEIRIGTGKSTITSLNLANSSIKSFQIGRSGEKTEYMDLELFENLTSLKLSGCKEITAIKNCHLGKNVEINGSNIFFNCKSLVSVEGSLKFTEECDFLFYGCESLVSIPDDIDLTTIVSGTTDMFSYCTSIDMSIVKFILSKLTNVTSLSTMFRGCTGLVTNLNEPFPSDIFINNSKITFLGQVFENCKNLTGPLPVDIYSNLPELSTLNSVFYGCNLSIESIDGFFTNNTKLSRLYDPFNGVSIDYMPGKDFLSSCTDLKSIDGLFEDQFTMTKAADAGSYFIHPDYFANNLELTSMSRAFENCQNLLGTIPEDLFFNNTKIAHASDLFNNCERLYGHLPNRLFNITYWGKPMYRYFSDLCYVDGMFHGCSGLTGNIPDTLFNNYNSIASFNNTFEGCSGLGTNLDSGETGVLPMHIFDGKGICKSAYSMFKGCSNLRGEITNPDFLKGAPNLTSVSSMFHGCKEIYGSIPEDLMTTKDSEGNYTPCKIDSMTYMFAYCRKLNGSIPPNMFKSFFNVTSLAGFFCGCNAMIGGIPYDLFSNCFRLTNLSSFLEGCGSLGTYRDNNIDKCSVDGVDYLMSVELFKYCPRLENLSSFVANTGSQFNGVLPEDLFVNNSELKFLSNTFAYCGVRGTVNNALLRNNSKITYLDSMFEGYYLTKITSGLINKISHKYDVRGSNGYIMKKNFTCMFKGQKNMAGIVPELWNIFPESYYDPDSHDYDNTATFAGCSEDKIVNWEDIPDTWKIETVEEDY